MCFVVLKQGKSLCEFSGYIITLLLAFFINFILFSNYDATLPRNVFIEYKSTFFALFLLGLWVKVVFFVLMFLDVEKTKHSVPPAYNPG